MSAGLVVGIHGSELAAAERDWLAHPAVVGVILFARNYQTPEQLNALTAELRALREPRLLVCVDQEGGRVQRFVDGFTRLPPLALIGRWYRSHPDRARDLAYRHGRVMAAEVLAHGVDLSLAPVLDLDRGSRVIGDRAFSDDPDAVIDIAGWYLAGMRDAGMKCCGKHFPGHGSIAADSHDEIVTDARTLAELADDLRPFQALAAQLDAVMPAHVCYPAVDPAPAGFARAWMDRLRGEIGFAGVIVSDDLDMAGAAGAGDLEQRWQACSGAGADLALVCRPESAAALLCRIPDDRAVFQAAQEAVETLYGRAAFTLDEQLRVPEFRAWRASLNTLSGESK
ncbi:MAG: beta-N-acetylhexosaminidase [Wenzhouxiangellaceae bacterium]|nr:beta-N-acetylhexosaminidase [Wenzhouxiangellaceae bacterium]